MDLSMRISVSSDRRCARTEQAGVGPRDAVADVLVGAKVDLKCQSADAGRRCPRPARIPQLREPASNQATRDGPRRAVANAALKTLRASAVLSSLARIASAFSIPQAESVPAIVAPAAGNKVTYRMSEWRHPRLSLTSSTT